MVIMLKLSNTHHVISGRYKSIEQCYISTFLMVTFFGYQIVDKAIFIFNDGHIALMLVLAQHFIWSMLLILKFATELCANATTHGKISADRMYQRGFAGCGNVLSSLFDNATLGSGYLQRGLIKNCHSTSN